MGTASIHEATGALYKEVRISKVRNAKLYINARINTYTDYYQVIEGYTGAMLEFQHKGSNIVWIMDKYQRRADNVAALAKCMNHWRSFMRLGVVSVEKNKKHETA